MLGDSLGWLYFPCMCWQCFFFSNTFSVFSSKSKPLSVNSSFISSVLQLRHSYRVWANGSFNLQSHYHKNHNNSYPTSTIYPEFKYIITVTIFVFRKIKMLLSFPLNLRGVKLCPLRFIWIKPLYIFIYHVYQKPELSQ